jgi:tetratricopeptide (TPR) repeat protein
VKDFSSFSRLYSVVSATALSAIFLPIAGAQQLGKVHFERAVSCYGTGNYACAIAYADSAIKADSSWPTPFVLRGLSRAASALLASAPQPGLRVVETDKPYFLRDLSVSAQHTLALSVQDFGGAIARDSGFAEAYYDRGYVRALLGRLPDAIADFGRAATIPSSKRIFSYPSDQLPGIAYNDRGLANEDRGATDSAIVDFSRAIALAPRYAPPRYNRARLLLRQGKRDAARVDFQRVLTLTNDPQITAAVHAYLAQLRR